MAEQILFNFAEEILRKLGSEVLQQFGLAWGATKQLKKLETTMSTVKSVLLDAEEQQVTNAAVKGWLQRLKDIVYDVDDLLDEFATYALRRKVEDDGRMIKDVLYFFTPSNPFIFRYNVGRKIKSLRERMNEIVVEMNEFKFIVKYVDGQIKVRRREETGSSVSNSEVIGRENDKEAIIKLLMHTDVAQNVAIVPIVAIGGLGKTTLAQLVYNDETVKKAQFDPKLWVCVSDDFDIKRLIAKILRVAGVNDSCLENLEFEPLQTRLQQELSEKKFFLVLDDVWNEDRVKWIKLRDLLMVGAQGSRIVVTTRSKTVDSIMGTLPSYDLKGLSEDDCLSVLVKWAFREGDSEKHDNLVKIGREIVKKCGGVPLAARTLGCLLFGKTDEHDWLSVQNKEMWKHVQKENDILPILKLSYDEMPSYLKQCFAYCSLFEKDKSIEKWRLIYLWMAQGFIESSEEELEDTGERYFNELVMRSFLFQEYDKYDSWYDEDVYKMHDLIHDLAQSVAGKECISVSSCTTIIRDGVRHVSFILQPLQFPEPLLKVEKLRTLLSCGTRIRKISTFRYLRVLDVNASVFETVLPSSIEDLVHLRYLTLNERYTNFNIARLLNLQYLEISRPKFRELSYDFGKLINLRYLNLRAWLTSLPEKRISGLTSLRTLLISACEEWTSLPEGMQHLTKLRKLEIIYCRKLLSLPSGMRYLTALEHLRISASGSLILSDDDFQGLRSLKFLYLEFLLKLQSLPKGLQQAAAATLTHMEIVDCWSMTMLLESLSNFRSLQTLVIVNCNALLYLPEGMQHLTALEHLRIRGCASLILSDDHFQGLRSLKFLDLESLSKLRSLPKGLQQAAAATLTHMEIVDCRSMTMLLESLSNFRSLQTLVIDRCPDLLYLPEGMQHLTALRSLSIHGCPHVSIRCRREVGEDWSKIAHVPHLHILDFE